MALFDHRDVGQAVVLGEVIGGGKSMTTTTDDDRIVRRFRYRLTPHRLPVLVAAQCLGDNREDRIAQELLSRSRRSRCMDDQLSTYGDGLATSWALAPGECQQCARGGDGCAGETKQAVSLRWSQCTQWSGGQLRLNGLTANGSSIIQLAEYRRVRFMLITQNAGAGEIETSWSGNLGHRADHQAKRSVP